MNYLVFTDEAGAYKRKPSDEHIRRHPYYIRSNIAMSVEDYRSYQLKMLEINKEFSIPINEEIKWSDLWCKNRGKPRNSFIDRMSIENLEEYYKKAFETATNHDSLYYIFTLTDVANKISPFSEKYLYKYHLQNAFQRIQMDLNNSDGFATFIMDELNNEVANRIKAVCHNFTVNGDFVIYNNLYHGVLIENSLYSSGIQLADYSAGVINGFLRGKTISHGKFKFATELYNKFIKSRLRQIDKGVNVGYSIISIPNSPTFRSLLESIFNEKSI